MGNILLKFCKKVLVTPQRWVMPHPGPCACDQYSVLTSKQFCCTVTVVSPLELNLQPMCSVLVKNTKGWPKLMPSMKHFYRVLRNMDTPVAGMICPLK